MIIDEAGFFFLFFLLVGIPRHRVVFAMMDD